MILEDLPKEIHRLLEEEKAANPASYSEALKAIGDLFEVEKEWETPPGSEGWNSGFAIARKPLEGEEAL